jgi:hypothetical protein
MVVRGTQSAEVEYAYRRATEIGESLGDVTALYKATDRATLRPQSSSTIVNANSMPEVTPPDVEIAPSRMKI